MHIYLLSSIYMHLLLWRYTLASQIPFCHIDPIPYIAYACLYRPFKGTMKPSRNLPKVPGICKQSRVNLHN